MGLNEARQVRLARTDDLPAFLTLLAACDVSACAPSPTEVERIWHNTMTRDGLSIFVSQAGEALVATCMLVTAPNLLREGRQHGFLENVATHPQWQGLGHGTAVVRAALDAAWAANCHHVLMQSGRADPRVHRFYESLGFVPGLRTAYVALGPQSRQ